MMKIQSHFIYQTCLYMCALLLVLLPTAEAVSDDFTNELFESWRWVHFTTASGLPSNHIADVVETSDGVVWALTEKGLAWYDGYQWHPMEPEAGWPSLRFDSLSPDDRGQLVAVAGGRLFLGNISGFREIPVATDGTRARISSAVALPTGDILLVEEEKATSRSLLWTLASGDLRSLALPENVDGTDEITLWRTASGSVWLTATSKFFRWHKGRWDKHFDLGETSGEFDYLVEQQGAGGAAFVQLPNNRAGIVEWQPDGSVEVDYRYEYFKLLGLDIDSTGRAYALHSSGLFRIRTAGQWRHLEPLPPQLVSVDSLKISATGNLWVGAREGLFHHRRTDQRWTHSHPSPMRSIGHVAEIFKSSDGSIWIGGEDGVEHHKPDGTIDFIHEILGTKLVTVTGIGEDADGGIWFGSGYSFPGAFRWDGSEWRHFGDKDGLAARFVHKIRSDREGRLWFLALGPITKEARNTGAGAFVFSDGTFERWGPDEGLINGRVYSFVQTQNEALWFGTSNGISRYKDGAWKHWQTQDGLLDSRVFTMASIRDERVWFGHQRAGLGFIDSSDEIHYLTTANGLVDNRVWDLKFDDQDRLWIATQAGFGCYDQGVWSSFTTRDGLAVDRLFPICPIGSRIYVGTRGAGLAILDLDLVQELPRVVIEPVAVDDNRALITWTAYSFGGRVSPDKLLTRYRINQGEWSQWSNERSAEILGLPNGSHQITIQAKGISPDFDQAGATREFDVIPPFYKQMAVVVPFVGFVVLLVAMSSYLLIRRRAHAAAAIRERTKAERTFRYIAEGTAGATGSDFFHSLVRHLAKAIEVRYALLTERVAGSDLNVRTLAYWNGDAFDENLSYCVTGTPSEPVLDGQEVCHLESLQQMFPDDSALRVRDAHSYVGVPVRQSSGEVIGHLGVMHVAQLAEDASRLGIMRVFATRAAAEMERRDTALKLQEAKEAAEAADRVKSEFLGNVSHEIRTPIMAILGATELVEPKNGNLKGQLDCREVILRNGKHLVTLVDDLLSAARVESGKIDVNIAECSLLEVLADVQAAVVSNKQAHLVDFKIILETAVPELIVSDAIRFRQALINIVNNAFKFTKQGHIHLIVNTHATETVSELVLRVADTGCGIASENLESIFHRFMQVGSPPEEGTSGMGLGLPLARSIVEQLGGHLTVQSELGTGSVFTIRLPLGEVAGTEWVDSNQFLQRLHGGASPYALRGKVLIAEDFQDTRELLEYAMSRAGAEVTTVTNGVDAVHQASQLEFDLIILDIRMPRMSGIEAVRALRRMGIRTPIIALTASAGPNSHERVVDAGFDDMWSKPMTLESVIASASAYLEDAGEDGRRHDAKDGKKNLSRFEAAVESFVQSLGQRIDELRHCVQSGDDAAAGEILHQLVGSGGLHGYMDLSTEAARLLEIAKCHSQALKTDHLATLEDLVSATVRSDAIPK